MAHKAPLLGLINQGKCLAVTHRAVLSRGSGLISFIAGSLSISPELSRARAASTLLVHRWNLFDGRLSEALLQGKSSLIDWA